MWDSIRDGDLQFRESNRTQDVDLLVVTLDEDGQIGHDRKDGDEVGDDGDHKKEWKEGSWSFSESGNGWGVKCLPCTPV